MLHRQHAERETTQDQRQIILPRQACKALLSLITLSILVNAVHTYGSLQLAVRSAVNSFNRLTQVVEAIILQHKH